MALFIIFVLFGIFFLVMTVFTLRGVSWNLVGGVKPTENRRDMVSINRFIGLRICLPFSIWSAVAAPAVFVRTVLGDALPFRSIALITILAAIAIISIFSAIPKIMRYKKS